LSALFTFRALDAEVTFRVDDPDLIPLATDLHSCACAGRVSCTEGHPADLAWKGCSKPQVWIAGEPWAEGLTLDNLFLQSENLITQLLLQKLPEYLQIHAGAVAQDGKALIICGPSRAGKTSVTLACLLENWGWLSDEFVLIPRAHSRQIEGLPRNFNIKESSFAHFPETAGVPRSREIFSGPRQMRVRFVDPTELPGSTRAMAAELSAIIFPEFVATLEKPRLQAKSQLQTVDLLMKQVNLWQSWAPQWLSAISARVPAFDLFYHNPRAIPSLLGAFFDSPPRSGEPS
jgi:hypothetical protein